MGSNKKIGLSHEMGLIDTPPLYGCPSSPFGFKGWMWNLFFLPVRQSLFCFSGAGIFCLAHGLRQLRRDDI